MQSIWEKHGYIEAPMNWNQSVLAQRRYWVPISKYNKPLLTKTRLRYRPGFHTNFVGPIIMADSDLVLIHLRSSDLEFCMSHEKAKYETAKDMHIEEKNAVGKN